MRGTSPVEALALAATLSLLGCASPPDDEDPGLAGKPLALPAFLAPGVDYALGPRDLLTVSVFELERPGEMTKLELQVSGQGDISVPFAGSVRAEGRTTAQLETAIAGSLRNRVLLDPQVSVVVKEYRSVEVGVTGAVTKPGVLRLDRNRVTLTQALALAGGLTKDAGTVAVVRPAPRASVQGPAAGPDAVEVDLVRLLEDKPGERDLVLESGSTVHVPEAKEFFVSGYVNRGGAFPFHRPTTVSQAIALAGGLDLKKASPSAVKIKRPGQDGTQVIDVDLDSVLSGSSPDLPVFPGDTIDAGRTFVKAFVTEILDALKGLIGVGVTAGAL